MFWRPTEMLKLGVLFLCTPTIVFPIIEEPGPQCGNTRCLGQGLATCEDGKCVCQGNNVRGLGNFVCVRDDEDFAVIFNDPVVRGFDASRTKIPLVCKFLATHISTDACTGGDPDNVVTCNGMCVFKFYAWGRRRRGKTFTRGIQVNAMVWKGNDTYFHSTRVEAQAVNGVYTYTEEGNTNPFGAPPYGDPVVTEVPDLGFIYTHYDTIDNFARIIAQPCGIEVGIRGVEQIGSSIEQPPGIYIKVLRACNPMYLSDDSSIFSPPPGHGPSLETTAQQLTNLLGFTVTAEIVAVYRAFTGQQMQDFPGAPIQIQMLAETVQECDQTKVFLALTLCLFVIDQPLFYKCIDQTSDSRHALGLLNECIFSICESNSFMCADCQDTIRTSQCHSRLSPGKAPFLDVNCTSLMN